MTQQLELIDRVRVLLAVESSMREVSMFGGRSFMVNDKMVVSARKCGDLLVRVDAERHDELTRVPGASQAEMGGGRTMGQGWVSVLAKSITSDERLAFWLDVGMEYNQASVADRR